MDDNEKNWNDFLVSGSISDYLKYKEYEKAFENEYINKGFGNQGTDNRGE